jgi:acyl carrier protein
VNDLDGRLTKCFVAVFPSLNPADASRASLSTLEQWDSVASVTLFTLIEEEFGVTLDMDALDHFNSFENIRAHIQKTLV